MLHLTTEVHVFTLTSNSYLQQEDEVLALEQYKAGVPKVGVATPRGVAKAFTGGSRKGSQRVPVGVPRRG